MSRSFKFRLYETKYGFEETPQAEQNENMLVETRISSDTNICDRPRFIAIRNTLW